MPAKTQRVPVKPLAAFYRKAGLRLPRIQVVSGSQLPVVPRALLVHDGDMTPTLEAHHGRTIHLRVLEKHAEGDAYAREVVLLLDGTNVPVEFGAIRIDLSLFPVPARAAILKGRKPLGTILREFAIPHRSAPRAYFRIRPDQRICEALAIHRNGKRAPVLYGRRNTLLDMQIRSLAEIVEILPP